MDYETDDTLEITVSISDDFGNSQSDNIVISVTDQNEAPSLVAVENNNLLSVNASLDDIKANGSNKETTDGSLVASVAVLIRMGMPCNTVYLESVVKICISSTGEITLAALSTLKRKLNIPLR